MEKKKTIDLFTSDLDLSLSMTIWYINSKIYKPAPILLEYFNLWYYDKQILWSSWSADGEYSNDFLTQGNDRFSKRGELKFRQPVITADPEQTKENHTKENQAKEKKTLVQQLLPLLKSPEPNETQRWICLVEVSLLFVSLLFLFFCFLSLLFFSSRALLFQPAHAHRTPSARST